MLLHQPDQYCQRLLSVYIDHKRLPWWPLSNALKPALQRKPWSSFHSSLLYLLAGPQSCCWKNNVLGELNWSFIALQALPVQLRLGLPSRHMAYCWSPTHPSCFLGWKEDFPRSFQKAMPFDLATLKASMGWLPHFPGCMLPSAAGR